MKWDILFLLFEFRDPEEIQYQYQVKFAKLVFIFIQKQIYIQIV